MSDVRLTNADQTATVWLDTDRLTFGLLEQLEKALAAAAGNPGTRVVVLRGRPGRFVAGHDRAELESLRTESDWRTLAERTQSVCGMLLRIGRRTPTVAYLDGPCLGPGLEIALACSYRLALCQTTTRLGFDQADLGLTPWGGGTQYLPRLVGLELASAMLLGERFLSGRQAHARGLVHRAFCERVAQIELEAFLGRLRRRPVMRIGRRFLVGPFVDCRHEEDSVRKQILLAVDAGRRGGTAAGLAEERRGVARLGPTEGCQRRIRRAHEAAEKVPPPVVPLVISDTGNDHPGRAAAALLRGLPVEWPGIDQPGRAAVRARLEPAIRDGLLTPLEADTLVRKRIAG